MDIQIDVSGLLPPAKGEAKSMFAEAHPHQTRVRELLEQARSAMAGREPLTGDLELEVTVVAPDGLPIPDATNLLGGIADVLQSRATGADVAHLGDLADEACYLDDAQIQQLRYRREYGGKVGYRVVIRALLS